MGKLPLIAVVDDDLSILRAMDRLIRAQGYEARVFSSATDFLESTGALSPDCVIVDVQMPDFGGLELCSELLAKGLNFPIIFITAHEDQHAEARAAELGAVSFLYKPIRGETLWPAVRAALERSANR